MNKKVEIFGGCWIDSLETISFPYSKGWDYKTTTDTLSGFRVVIRYGNI